MIINWYPGHMKKTHDLIKQNLKLVDCVVELLDARMPYSSKNPIFEELIGNKTKVVALNKADLADPVSLQAWVEDYRRCGIEAVPIDAIHGKGISNLLAAVKRASQDLTDKLERQNRKQRAIRMMIIGIPNVGKSSLINNLAGSKSAKTGNRPGVTKGKQWVRVKNDIELFDTPGILWPKIEDQYVGLNLAFTGSIKDEILPLEEIALYFVRDTLHQYKENFETRYNVEIDPDEPLKAIEDIAIRRGCIQSKHSVDYQRVSRLILDEFRRGIIGQISLETPESVKEHLDRKYEEPS